MKKRRLSGLVVALGLAIIAGCGGGGGSGVTTTSLTAVKAMGDSLSDSGVFSGVPVASGGLGTGRVFSVQSSPGEITQLWTERIAAIVGDSQLCNYFQLGGAAPSVATCGSFAVGGSRINNRYLTAPQNTALFSVPAQIQTAASLGNFKSTDLLLIDGGGNDAADLFGAFLRASPAPAGDGGATFAGIVGTAASSVTAINTALASVNLSTAGVLYMQALADELSSAITSNALNKGATHVAILNIPGITKTPRFQMVLAAVEQQTAAATNAATGAATRAAAEAQANTWIQAFNARLASNFAGDSRVVVVDFYTAFLDQVANPSQYGLTNVTQTACPATGVGSDGLPTYNFETCTAASLSAEAGRPSPNWWKTYAFSDGFHPTPYGHQLMSQLVSRSLAQAGWIK